MPQNSSAPTTDALAARRFLPALLLLFIGSGCAALIYEVVWLQQLQLVIGASGISLGVLLGTFMGGMCLGSLVLPRLISKSNHPLRVYAMLELGVGVCGLLVLNGLPLLEKFYTHFGGEGSLHIMLRGLVAGICLLPPTILMGATLPAMSRWIKTSPAGVSWLGFFYGGNTAGAVLGCLLAGFYLLPFFDMPFATYVAVVINVVVALAAFGLSAIVPNSMEDEEAPERGADLESLAPATGPSPSMIYVAIGLSGMTALGAEVVWTRLLSLMFGATVYTFSIILAVFLLGIGIGSTVGAMIARGAKSPRLALGVCQMLLVGAIAWTAYMSTHSLPFWPINPSIFTPPMPWINYQLDLARCMWAILPATLLWGASFPLALAAAATRRSDPGRLVGGVYAANTVGAIVGALGFSLVLFPALGSENSQRLLIGLACVASIVTLLPMLWPTRAEAIAGVQPRMGLALTLAVSVTLASWLAASVSPPYWGMVAYGRFCATWVPQLVVNKASADGLTAESAVPQNDGTNNIYCEYVGEGMNVSVAVSMSTSGIRSFHGAGKVQASNDPQDMRLQRVLGHISVLAHKDPDSVKKVLVVACGAGVTAGSFIPYKNITDITIVDIEPFVPTRVTPRFAKENYGVVGSFDEQGKLLPGDPRVHVVIDDGRHFLRTTKEKFDVITSDPIDPWVKGCASLNTVEYYQMARDHLNPGGVVSLWIPLYESNTETAKSVLGTFFQVFPQGIFWSNDIKGEGYDAVLFGRNDPTQINIDEMDARLNRLDYAMVKQSLADVGINSAVDLLLTYAGSASHLQNWMKGAEINTDRNLRLQYLAGRWLNSYVGREILSKILEDYQFPTDLFTGSPAKVAQLKQALEDEGRARFAHGGIGSADNLKLLDALLKQSVQPPIPGPDTAPGPVALVRLLPVPSLRLPRKIFGG